MNTAAPLQTAAVKILSLGKSAQVGLHMQRKCACGSAKSLLTGECVECKGETRLQAKLSIGASNDPLEQEADRIAAQVLTAPAHSGVSAIPPRIQRLTGQTTSDAGVAPPSLDRVLAGSGRPLDSSLQQDMGRRFGHDFSHVRVHTGSHAEQSARDVNAHAYTAGHHIVFGASQFAPGSNEGRKLIAHELTHVVQQSGSNGLVGGRNNGQDPIPLPSTPTTIQRAMKFELQTTNRIWRNDGVTPKLLDRKYGPKDFLVETNNGLRLESETHGVLEFETEWFRKWSELEKALAEAVAMTKKMNDAPNVGGGRKAFPFEMDHLREGSRRELKKGIWDWKKGFEGAGEKILGKEETLEVEIVDGSWKAAIQSSESIALTQFESLLKEHEPSQVEASSSSADEIVMEAATFAKKPPAELANLRSFLQIIFYYIERGVKTNLMDAEKGTLDPAKFAFFLMNRTSFSSIFNSLLSKQEQILFMRIVNKQLILKKLNLSATKFFFKEGHGGGRGPTIHRWLLSIINPGKFGRMIEGKKGKKVGRDLLSPPRDGSAAMGAFDVETKKGTKNTNLIRFETRNTLRDFKNVEKVSGASSIRVQPAEHWIDYARELFQYAAENRKRPETKDDPDTPQDETEKTTLIYDPDATLTPDVEAADKLDLDFDFEAIAKLDLKLGDEKKPGFDIELRKILSTLLNGKLQPFIYSGIATGGLSAGAGTTFDPFTGMSLFLTGKGGIRTEWFKSIEVGAGVETGWAFGKDRTLRLGIGWDVWQRLDSDKQRTHLLNVFLSKRF